MAFKNFLHKDIMAINTIADYGYRRVKSIYQIKNTLERFYSIIEVDGKLLGFSDEGESKNYTKNVINDSLQIEGDCYLDAHMEVIAPSTYIAFCKVVKNLQKNQKQEDRFIVIFELDGFLVTEGEIDKQTGHAELFGFDSKEKMWQEIQVDFNMKSSIESISIGTAVLDENGNLVGLNKKINEVI